DKRELCVRLERTAANVSVDGVDREGGHLHQNVVGTYLWHREVTVLDYAGRAELFDKCSLHVILLIVIHGAYTCYSRSRSRSFHRRVSRGSASVTVRSRSGPCGITA